MVETDKPEFFMLLKLACKTINGKKPDGELLGVWWSKFEGFKIEDLRNAFSKVTDEDMHRLTPAKLLKHLPSKFGHPGAEEAFSHLLATIDGCGYLSDEMRASWGVCSDHLNRNDRVAARMAFREKYEALVNLAITPPNWSWYKDSSMEFEQEQRTKQEQLIQFKEKGWITEDKMNERLSIISEKFEQPLLPHQTQKDNLKKIKNMIKIGLNKTG